MTRKTNAVGTVHQYRYGTSEVTGFDAPWRREVYRPTTVHPKEPWNREIHERCMATGPDDATERHDKSAHYSAECACCYLNITHTKALHDASVDSVKRIHAARARAT